MLGASCLFQTPLLVCWLFTANSFFLLCFFLAFSSLLRLSRLHPAQTYARRPKWGGARDCVFRMVVFGVTVAEFELRLVK